MSQKAGATFFTGLLTGIIVTLVLVLAMQIAKAPQNLHDSSSVIVEMDGAKLTRQALESKLAGVLVPMENNHYLTLSQGVDRWLEEQLLQKEAAVQKTDVKSLYAREIWSKVKTAPAADAKIRQAEHVKIKQEYLSQLQQKYNVKIHLKKPDSYVPGLGNAQVAPAAAPTAAAPQPAAGVLPPATANFGDLAGRPSMGPNNAPITLVIFSDFFCPFCKRVEPTIDEIMKNYAGKVRKVWRHYPLPFHTGADRAHEASECAHDQGKFWEYHAKLLENVGAAKDDAALIKIAEDLKLDKKSFEGCLSSGKYKALVQKEIAAGAAVGVQGTPAVFVNGRLVTGAQPYQNFSNLIESILDPSKAAKLLAPAAAPAQQPAPPPPPTNVEFKDLEGRPSQGPKNAPITLVEFSDFFCPFCGKVEPTIDQLMKNYEGKIRKVWRHYPLPFHTGADRAHEASECAHEQGKFWNYHAILFQNLGAAKDDAALIKFAEQSKLDKKKFEACLTSGKYKEFIKKEIAAGVAVGVRGTPAVFVNGQLVSGAQPYEAFDAVVKSKLSKS